MERYVCIHGHFYQPPRENAWLESIELQDSAYPFHDWNERVSTQCYAPNSASRILDAEGYITQIVNNYAKISFNFGPTLLAWLEEFNPDVYQAILTADQESQQNFSGHGSALAQAYNHIIMPLANRQDKYTQVFWGIKDFEHRFGRIPEGMWLPETAVDKETLDIMAEQGIKFTILAPHQAARVRQIGTDTWSEVANASIDPTMAYELNLPSGRKMNLFFYDSPIAHAVAFEELLKSGENFAHRLASAFSAERTWPQLIHIATDGETYGHYYRFADMALAYAIYHIETNNLAKITNYGEYLEKHPPTHEVEITENTSWSCVHGIERWRSDCGCNTGMHAGWNQAWRTPLRNAFNWLRDTVAPAYEAKAREFLKDPWGARNSYIEIIIDRSMENVQRFLNQQETHELNEAEMVTTLKLLELQRHAMLMYTSCGWFFDELSGIETVQVIQYAGRVIQLMEELFGDSTENHFLSLLEQARSNIPENMDGRVVYQKFVRPAMIDLTKVTAHYAISSLFEEYGEQPKIYCYHVDMKDYQTTDCGKAKLAAGWAEITSEITREHAAVSFGVLHFGDHNINAGVHEYQGGETYQNMIQETTKTCTIGDFPEVIRLLDKHFGMSTYSVKDLFRDEQRKVLDNILESALSEIEAAYRQVYERHYPPMRYLSELKYPVPKSFHTAAEFIVNGGLREAFSADSLDLDRIRSLLEETQTWQVELDSDGLSYLLQNTLEKMMIKLFDAPENIDFLQELLTGTEILPVLPFQVDLWKMQNQYHELLVNKYPELKGKAQQGDTTAQEWVTNFESLGQRLSMRVG